MENAAAISCTRRIEFCAGHRVLGHENKCASWHGHQYAIEVTAQAEKLDGIGRVVDFSVLKERIGSWIDLNWDHGFLIYDKDQEMCELSRVLASNIETFPSIRRTHKTFFCPFNPTAENIASYLLNVICPMLMQSTGVIVTRIIVHETPNCKAEACLEPTP